MTEQDLEDMIKRADIDMDGVVSKEEFFNLMRGQFTNYEWSNIRGPAEPQKQVDQFYLHWALKESYIKAVGIGLGFELQRAQFSINQPYAKQAKLGNAQSKARLRQTNEHQCQKSQIKIRIIL